MERSRVEAFERLSRLGNCRTMVVSFLSSSLGSLRDFAAAKAQDALLTVLAAGPVPQHVAFILDGNRRYARSRHMPVKQGHTDGFYALRKVCGSNEAVYDGNRLRSPEQMLEICIHLNIRCVSAYTFSIENFKRAPDEVDALMELAEEKLLELCREG